MTLILFSCVRLKIKYREDNYHLKLILEWILKWNDHPSGGGGKILAPSVVRKFQSFPLHSWNCFKQKFDCSSPLAVYRCPNFFTTLPLFYRNQSHSNFFRTKGRHFLTRPIIQRCSCYQIRATYYATTRNRSNFNQKGKMQLHFRTYFEDFLKI